MIDRHGNGTASGAGRSVPGRLKLPRRAAALIFLLVPIFASGIGPASATPDGQGATPSLADRLKAVQNGEADHPGAKLPAWKPAGAGTFKSLIPMVKGLIVVTAVNQPPLGDYESIKTITEAGGATVQMGYSANLPKVKDSPLLARPKDLGNADPMKEFPDTVACTRTIDAADLANALGYSELFCEKPVEHFPGSTSISASTVLLTRLRGGQAVDFHFAQADKWAVLAQMGAQFQGQKPIGPVLSKFAGQMMYACQLRRVGTDDVAIPVLVNDQRVLLPALHASCTLEDAEQVHFFWLDQPSNPITLAFSVDQILLQAINITFPLNPPPGATQSAAASTMEQALADKKPVQIYGIYFDFNSAAIKPESERELREIAAVMQKNPDWKLSVSGNTDNIGDGKSNLALSQKRAAAVKDALVSRFKITPDRLVTDGYGASRPVETNDTLEGRARNRRVELQRE
jgi:outer membrane protein OmpA-like peptidoglycan-associated protein